MAGVFSMIMLFQLLPEVRHVLLRRAQSGADAVGNQDVIV